MDTSVLKPAVEELQKRGHKVLPFGALLTAQAPWPEVGIDVAKAVVKGEAEQGILFCWTGTGVSMAANKVKGARAALCWDAPTAAGARKWNDANILVMSLRYTSEALLKEILEAWFCNEPSLEEEDQACIRYLKDYDS